MIRALLVSSTKHDEDFDLRCLVQMCVDRDVEIQVVLDTVDFDFEDKIVLLLSTSARIFEICNFQNSVRRRTVLLEGSLKIHLVEKHGFAGELESFSLARFCSHEERSTTGFWAKKWEVSLMDGEAVLHFESVNYCAFNASHSLLAAEILAEYCQVIYGVEWLRTLDVAPVDRRVEHQSYLTLVGIYEGARRFLADVEVNGVTYQAFASPHDPLRHTAIDVAITASVALEQMLLAPPAAMAAQLVERMRHRYTLASLRQARGTLTAQRGS